MRCVRIHEDLGCETKRGATKSREICNILSGRNREVISFHPKKIVILASRHFGDKTTGNIG